MLSRKQIRAARHVAEGRLSKRAICRKLGIDRATIFDWLKLPEFEALVAQSLAAYKARVRARGVASLENRVRHYDRIVRKINRVIAARAESMKGVPGGDTGLLTRRYKILGSGKLAEIVEEFEVDTALLKECRETLLQAARELGQLDKDDDGGGSAERVIKTRPLKGGNTRPPATNAVRDDPRA